MYYRPSIFTAFDKPTICYISVEFKPLIWDYTQIRDYIKSLLFFQYDYEIYTLKNRQSRIFASPYLILW